MIGPKLRRKYKKPAVKEAIFEAKFTFDNKSFGITAPGQIYEKIKGQYPKKQDIKYAPVFLDNSENVNTSSFFIQVPLIQARKEDDSELLQVGPGIAVANRLKYTSWEDFTPGIQIILDAYVDLAKPRIVTRIGTRYINSFLIPEENVSLVEYFNLGVQAPYISGLQGFDLTVVNKLQSVSGQEDLFFDVRTRFFTDALRPNETGSKFILDIDCYLNNDLEPDIEKILKLATQAHDTLEAVFENIITDKTRTLMEVEECMVQ